MHSGSSLPRQRKPRYAGLSDVALVEFFKKELETRSSLTFSEWDAYNGALKRSDPQGYVAYRAEAAKRIDMRNAKERLTIEELQQIIDEKRNESKDGSTK